MPAPRTTRRRIDIEAGRAAVHAWRGSTREADLHAPQAATAPDAQPAIDRPTLATAVRFTLEELASRAPGNALEVRVPPFGATQCIEGPTHRRGTPPAVVEMKPEVWLALATGRVSWADAVAAGQVDASGERSDLSALLPLD
ncbi:sterol carrier family protein [Demequina sp. NBRC 110055]|uniref:sterol carrier family protein n=1 Tax=Demequina sp. NBRC 110055 TaxID=1570344 RepID=UPI000A047233|nr:sterol carrier family protein [Demequina sp. NBRC 110055]